MLPYRLTEKVRYFRSHSFVRNVATLQAGSFLGNIIQAVAGIIIARLLQPELFGIYALAFSMASITTLVIGMGIQEATSSLLGRAYAKRDSDEIADILGFMFKITLVAALVVIVFSAFLPQISIRLYGNSLVGVYAAIVALSVVFSSLFFTLTYSSLQITGRVKALAVLMVSDQTIRYGVSLAFVILGFGIMGAVSGNFIGALIVFVTSALVFKKIKKSEELLPGLKKLIGSVREVSFKKYLTFTFWVALDRNMGNLYMALPVILTGIYVTASEVSFFKLAFGYTNLALSLLGPISILLNVEFPKIETGDKSRLYRNFYKVSTYSIGLSLLLTVGAIVVSPLFFRLVYGESYLPSVQYIFGLLIYGALFGIGVGLGPMWRAINKVKISILINTVILIIGVPIGLYLVKSFGIWGSVAMVTIWFTASHFISFLYLIRKLKIIA